jgi:hypothetical protein
MTLVSFFDLDDMCALSCTCQDIRHLLEKDPFLWKRFASELKKSLRHGFLFNYDFQFGIGNSADQDLCPDKHFAIYVCGHIVFFKNKEDKRQKWSWECPTCKPEDDRKNALRWRRLERRFYKLYEFVGTGKEIHDFRVLSPEAFAFFQQFVSEYRFETVVTCGRAATRGAL